MEEQHPHPPPLPPPPPLAHALPAPPPPAPVFARFFLGLCAGVLVSALVWIGGWNVVTGNSQILMLLFPAVKILIGLIFLFVPRWRSLGAGILISIALGTLIFGGMVIHSAVNAVSNSPGWSSICGPPRTSSYPPATQSDDATTEPADSTTQPVGATTEPATTAP